LELFLCTLPHRLLIVVEIFVSRVCVSLLAGFLMLPVLFTFVVSAGLVVGQLRLLELVFQEGLLVDLPAILEAIDRSDHILLD